MLVRSRKRLWWGIAVMLVVLLALVVSCQGTAGVQGPPGTSTGTVSGTVTSSLGGKPADGVAITTEPAIKDVTITTDANGAYSATLPIGTYNLTFKKDNHTAVTLPVSVVAGQSVTKPVVMKVMKPVLVDAGKDQQTSPATVVTLSATASPQDGSTVTGYQWSQTAGVDATIDNPKNSTIQVTLDKAPVYKAALIKALQPANRLKVMGISPFTLEEAEAATFKVTVTTSSGTYSDTVNVVAALPYVINTGLQAVAKGEPVLVQGKERTAYAWTLVGPAGSKATLSDATDRFPSFTPDVVGKYTLTERNSGDLLDVYAGTWSGAISGQDGKGRPLAAGCTVCHDGKIAPDNFTDWAKSGHAEIFTQNINDPNGHWSVSCASCHTVGYDPAVDNGGFDEALKAEGWQVPAHGDVGLWTEILAKYPKTAKLANIQCENCHGPNNDSTLHGNKIIDAARVSVSSDVCGACHGEPPRHGRFQQWAESAHSGIESTATPERGTSSSCGRCHLAQGFLTWLKQGDLTKQIQGAKGNATVDEMIALGAGPDRAEGVTCVVCHDPHAQGTTSGEPNTATVRIQGNTAMLPSGYQAKEVGKGALCITCHNTRNALHNDANAPTSYSAPHTAAQGDVLMGENAYFVESQRSPHANIKDTCVTCHMEESPPPSEFSYNQGGTNHSFGANIKVCSSCHSTTLNGKALQAGVEDKIHKLGEAMSAYLLKKIPAQVTISDYTPHVFGGKSYDVKSVGLSVAKDNIASLEPTEPHGQQGFIVKFKTPLTFTYSPAGEASHTVSLTEAEVQLGDIQSGGVALIAFTDPLVKAGWNYNLLHGDASEGVHNPAFTNAVIDASIKALK